MKRWNIQCGISIIWLSVVATGCSKNDDNTVQNSTETITTVVLNFREAGTTNVFNVIYSDPDGAGGNPPVASDDITLTKNTNYECSIFITNDETSPVTDITAEISAEANDHQLYIIPAGISLTVSIIDTDQKGLPLGLLSAWTTGDSGMGTVSFVLKHKPGNKAMGDPVTKGETDFDLTFIAKIQ
jgi:hypothetical protein